MLIIQGFQTLVAVRHTAEGEQGVGFANQADPPQGTEPRAQTVHPSSCSNAILLTRRFSTSLKFFGSRRYIFCFVNTIIATAIILDEAFAADTIAELAHVNKSKVPPPPSRYMCACR